MSRFLFVTKPFVIEPLGIMYLSSSLKSNGHETFWLTTDDKDLVEKAKGLAPDFIGYSVMTGDHKLFADINNVLKSKIDFFSIAGGPHPTFFPEYIHDSSFDAICRGEGESALVSLVNGSDNALDNSVPNFWFNSNGIIRKNPQGCLFGNLDDIPFPDRDLFYGSDEKQRANPIKHFIAGRGCPYACTYCFNHSYNKLYENKGKRIRLRSVENLIEEVEQVIKDYPTKFIYFQDDTFILKKSWVEAFSKEYVKRVNLPFHCHVRANLVDEDIVRLLSEANCYSVHIAVESGNERLRNDVLKRGMSEEQIYGACELLHKYDIKFMLQNILGLPTGNLKNDFETLEMNIKCRPDYAWASIFQPYPGTDLAKLCIDEGLVREIDLNNIQSSFFDRSIINIGNKKEVEYLQKLFAVSVEYPVIYRSGLLKALMNLPDSEKIRGLLNKVYKSFRKTSDKKLYGMEL